MHRCWEDIRPVAGELHEGKLLGIEAVMGIWLGIVEFAGINGTFVFDKTALCEPDSLMVETVESCNWLRLLVSGYSFELLEFRG